MGRPFCTCACANDLICFCLDLDDTDFDSTLNHFVLFSCEYEAVGFSLPALLVVLLINALNRLLIINLSLSACSSCIPTRGRYNARSTGSHSDDRSIPGPSHSQRGIHRAAFTWSPALSLHYWQFLQWKHTAVECGPVQSGLIPAFGTHSMNCCWTNSAQPQFGSPLMALWIKRGSGNIHITLLVSQERAKHSMLSWCTSDHEIILANLFIPKSAFITTRKTWWCTHF